MPRTHRVFVSPVLAFGIHALRWHKLLRAFRVSVPFDVRTASALERARFLWGVDAGDAFHEAMDVIELLMSTVGHTALRVAAREEKRRLPRNLPPGDVAATIVARRVRDASWEPVLEEALLQFARLVPHDYQVERPAVESRGPADPARCVDAAKAALGADFEEAYVGVDEGGAIHVALASRGAPRAAVRSGKRVVRRDREVDLLRVDASPPRLLVRTADQARVHAYARAFGSALFHDPEYFTDAATLTLRALSQLGSARLAALVAPGIRRMRVVEIIWDDGEGTTHFAHGSDALAAFEARRGNSGGYVLSALLRIDASDAPRPVDVAIELPNRICIREPRHEAIGRAALHAIGLDAPGSAPDDPFTLYPFIHAEWRWRRVLGDASFESLQRRGILVPARGVRMVAGRPEEKLGWNYVSFALRSRPGVKYAVARIPWLPSRLVRDEDQAMWTLDIRAVAAAHQQALRITRPPPPEAIAEGVLGLGTLAGRGVSLCFWLVLRAPATAAEARGWVSAMQRASAGAHPVILLPEGRSIGAAIEVGLSTAALFSAEGAAPVVLARAGEMLGVEVADPSRLVAEGIRFVVEASTSRCWLDGVELVHLSEAGAVMLRVLAAARGALVSTADVEKVISPNRTSRGAASETAARIGEGIRRSFDDAGKAPPADADRIIEALGKKGWRMTVACEVK